MESIFGKLNTESHWYALTTRNRHEKKVHERLIQKQVNTYLPLYETIKHWSDRKKRVTEPLFSCYLFVNITLKDRMSVLQTDGAVRLVTFNNVPVPIPPEQIDAIRIMMQEKLKIQHESFLTIGQHVEVMHGPLKGMRGILIQKKGQSRFVIAIDGIRQAISVEIDSELVERIQ